MNCITTNKCTSTYTIIPQTSRYRKISDYNMPKALFIQKENYLYGVLSASNIRQ